MKIWSAKELEYIKNPWKFGGVYSRVLKHRIRKKLDHMMFAICLTADYKDNSKLDKNSLWGPLGTIEDEIHLSKILGERKNEVNRKMLNVLIEAQQNKKGTGLFNSN